MSQAALFYCGGAKKLQFLLASLRLGQLESAEVNALGIRHVPEVEGKKIPSNGLKSRWVFIGIPTGLLENLKLGSTP